MFLCYTFPKGLSHGLWALFINPEVAAIPVTGIFRSLGNLQVA